jgi:hypothetical protein
MVIFHSYVSLPEGNFDPPRHIQPFLCQALSLLVFFLTFAWRFQVTGSLAGNQPKDPSAFHLPLSTPDCKGVTTIPI